ncbi:putative transmembrane protein [Mycobacterium tuberculosis]|nr:putative transmembrane protein [Mycobacterium tuberculosis]
MARQHPRPPPGRRPRGATPRLRRRPAPTGNHTPCHATHPNRTHLRCRGHTLLTRSRRLTNVTRRQQIHRTSHHPGPTQQPNTTASQRHRGRHHRRRSRRPPPPSRRTTTPTPHPRHRRPPRTRIIVGCRATRQRPNHPAGHRDLASGWIPPHIRLPAHITLLEPAPRRRHATVTDLLGTTTVAAAHHPHGYLSQPDPDTPALTGDRTARIAPTIDELGPTLVETVRRRDALPRIAQAVVGPPPATTASPTTKPTSYTTKPPRSTKPY